MFLMNRTRLRYLLFLLGGAAAVICAYAGYRHLIAQSMSQGFVLQEFAPVVNALIGAGSKLNSLDDQSRTVITVAAFLFLVASYALSLRGKKSEGGGVDWDRWLLFVGLSFGLIILSAGAGRLAAFAIAMPGIIALGWFKEYRSKTSVEDGRASRLEIAVLAGIILLGLFVRLYQLDVFPIRYTVDEQLLAGAALQMRDEPGAFFTEPHYMKPHLIKIVAIRTWFSLFGAGLFQHRSVSALEGTLCILLVYVLARRLWGKRAGMFSAFFVALDPWHIGYSKFGVHEIQGPLFLVLLLLVMMDAVRAGGKRTFALLGLLAGAAAYLYLSNVIMAPFAFGAVIILSILIRRIPARQLAAELAVMTLVFVLTMLPHLTFGRANLMEMLSIYSNASNFLAAAKHFGVSAPMMVLVNLLKAGEAFLQVGPVEHPARIFRPSAVMSVLALLGLGAVIARRRNQGDLLILLWIPVAFLPSAVGFGFEERRLFATLMPVPMMLAGLVLAHLWDDVRRAEKFWGKSIPRAFVMLVLGISLVSSFYSVFADTDSSLGRASHPRKAAEFVASMPETKTVIITSRVKEYPFLLYLMSCDKVKQGRGADHYVVAEFDEIEGRAAELAANPSVVLVLDPGPREERLLERIGMLNPEARMIREDEYWACIMNGDAATP